MQKILESINARCAWDCTITSYDGWRLTLASGTSIEYALPLAVFSGVSYIACPTEFSHAHFRLASEEERQHVKELVPLDDGDFVIAITAETMADLGSHVFFLVAQEVQLSALP